MLQDYHLSDKYWEQALLYVVMIENMVTSTNRPDVVPYTAFTGLPCDYSKLRMPFGTLVYVLRHDRSTQE